MSDQCARCTAHGDRIACAELPCNIRESWAYQRLERDLAEARDENAKLKAELADFRDATVAFRQLPADAARDGGRGEGG